MHKQFGTAKAFRDYLMQRADPAGSRVHDAVADTVNYVADYPGVAEGRTKSAVVVLSDMDTFRWHKARDFGVIVDDERNTACKCDAVQVGSQFGDLSRRVRFGAELYQIDASIDHLFSHPPSLNGIYITQVQDTVEPAAT